MKKTFLQTFGRTPPVSWIISPVLLCGSLLLVPKITYANDRLCPKDFTGLSVALTENLHHYLNRSYTKFGQKLYAQAVSLPDREPLPIKYPDPSVYQLFLTVQHRRSGQQKTENYFYWLFLVQIQQKWQLSMAFTRVGSAPPIDVSEGAIADAVQVWLRDYCWQDQHK